MAASTTHTMEMSVLVDRRHSNEKSIDALTAEAQGHRLGDDGEAVQGADAATPATTTVERWNYPRTNLYRVGATFFSFLVLGANDAAYGVSDGLRIRHGHG